VVAHSWHKILVGTVQMKILWVLSYDDQAAVRRSAFGCLKQLAQYGLLSSLSQNSDS